MTTKPPVENLTDQLAAAIGNESIPNIYANGFTNAISTGDIILVLMQNGKEVATLNLSYTLAKTLAVNLAGMISNLENLTGNAIMTIDQIAKAMEKDPANPSR